MALKATTTKKNGAGKGSPAAPKPRAAPKAATAPASAPAVAPPAAPAQMTDGQLRQKLVQRVAVYTSQHRAVDNKIAGVRNTLKELTDERKEIRLRIQNAGVPQPVFDTAYEQVQLKVKQADLAAIDYATQVCREAMGLALAQPDLPMFQVPQIEIDWELVGYQDCIRGLPANPQKAEVPEDQWQTYMSGYGRGTETNAKGLKVLKEEPAPVRPTGLPDGEGEPRPDWSMWDRSHHHWTDEQKAAFQVWYEALEPTLQPDVTHPGVLARLAYLDDQADDEPSDKGGKIDTADDFEASEEELKAQGPRRAAQERKAAEAAAEPKEPSDGALV